MNNEAGNAEAIVMIEIAHFAQYRYALAFGASLYLISLTSILPATAFRNGLPSATPTVP
jgi:hypothetical protein